MPKFACRKCRHEFWGWGIHSEYIAGKRVACPDCNGSLVLQRAKPQLKLAVKKAVKTSSAA